MTQKLRVAILFGGKSAEHEVSVQSAQNIARALDADAYDTEAIGIDRSGKWIRIDVGDLKFGQLSSVHTEYGQEISDIFAVLRRFDVVFPALHGPFGEDGTVQGLLRLVDLPFVGASVTGSALGMDKDVMKRLLRDANIPIAKFEVVHAYETPKFADLKKKLKLPMFVKPANLGSSVGVSKVKNEKEFLEALEKAFEFDTKVLVEECIDGKEVECSVLGNENPTTSLPGELVIKDDFYSYEAKYLEPDAMVPQIPANLTKATIKKVQELAVKTFQVLCCEGMGRVDFFVTKKGKVLVNEINTIPGFTNISMYPKMWEASSLPYPKLIDKLLELAIERHEKERRLKTSRV